MKILSFDCANKSFAYSYIECDASTKNDGKIVFESLNLMSCNAVDLIPFLTTKGDNKANLITRSKGLFDFLDSLSKSIKGEDIDLVLIEYQMGPNDKSRTICDQLVMYYMTKGIKDFYIIPPSYKNEIYLVDKGEFWRFLEKTIDQYRARKNHSKYNFEELCKEKKIDIKHINKKWLSDVGDSFMQAVVYVAKLHKK